MNNWEIIGHKRAVNLLSRSIERGRINHAYLFSGIPGIGKTTLATTFTKALNCTSDVKPCNECRNCRSISKRTHPDIRLLQVAAGQAEAAGEERTSRAGKGHTIGIEQIRELQRDTSLLPYEGKWKVYIIRNAEDMTIEAANCLLKTLEEPPSSVVLILTCADAKILPATIVSRCQQVNLWPLATADVETALQQRYSLTAEEAGMIAHVSNGRIGWALEAAADTSVISERESRLLRIIDLATASRTERFKYADEVATSFNRDPMIVYATLDLWLTWWRDLLLIKNSCRELITNLNMVPRLTEQAMKYTVEQLYGFLVAIEATRNQLEQNVNAKLALEVMMLNVPQAHN